MKPVILLTFSNDRDNYLEMITRERKEIYKALQDYHDKDFIQVYKEEYTSIEDIFALFNRFRDRIVIFHYAGHANGTHLQLQDLEQGKQKANVKGLARLLGQQKELQLVFLNGCATAGQVALLLSSGVPAVIATSVLIDDKKATEFAEQFYEALASQATVQQAFDTAGAFINARYEQSIEIKIHRDLSWQGKESAADNEIPWGLYINKNRPEVLEWKLPSSRFPPPPPPPPDNSGESRPLVIVNILLLDTLPYEIAQYSAKMSGLLGDEETDPRDIRQALMDSFPAPVGLQLRRLFNIYTIDVDRLRQLVITYETIAKLICFTMLSQLWDEKYKNPGIVIHKDSLMEIKNLLHLEAGNYKEFNCFNLIKANTEIFHENKITYFVEELSTLRESFLEKDEFYQAHLFMEEIKREFVRDNIKAREIEDLCVQAEKHLSIILKKLAFITRYKLTTIKNIEIIKLKHKEPRFKHKKVILDKITAGFAVQISEHDSFTDNKSVIFLKSSKDVSTYLNLSPFVIDKSVLYKDKRDKPKKLSVLYFYSCQEPPNPDYYYSSFEKERVPLIVSDKEYKEIKEQWEEFKEDVLGSIKNRPSRSSK